MLLNKMLSKISKIFNTKPVAKYGAILLALLVVVMIIIVAALAIKGTVPVLEPKGLIATQQRNLIFFALILSMVVILPVYALTFHIVWKYRATNKKKAKYSPDWDGHKGLEFTWWAIPCVIILILSVVTWQTSHSLDPFKPLASDKKPLTIQVVALQWKWLFIYPDQHIATVNYAQIPEDTPINFEVTSDAPMNSFWIPQLGGQIYAMSGMLTELHLLANEQGVYFGSSANISGKDFANMEFMVKVTSAEDFQEWAATVNKSSNMLDMNAYQELAKPVDSKILAYTLAENNLQSKIIMKYKSPHSPLADTGRLTHDEASH